MAANTDLLKQVRAALEHESHVNLRRAPIQVDIEGTTTVLQGEVTSIEEKRTAVECVRHVAGVEKVVDRLRVRPARRLGDGAIRDAVCGHLLCEPEFRRLRIECRVAGDREAVARAPDQPEGAIEACVKDGVVTLTGEVRSRSHKRLAAVLAWWSPGCRNVTNELVVKPPQRDSDDEIRDAVALVLNKDPIVHSSQLTAQVRDGRVVLRGIVATREEKWMAERDVWFIEGVCDVVNELEIYRGPSGREPLPADPPPFE